MLTAKINWRLMNPLFKVDGETGSCRELVFSHTAEGWSAPILKKHYDS